VLPAAVRRLSPARDLSRDAVVFDASGRRVAAGQLRSGVYFIRTPAGLASAVVIR